MKRDFLSAFAEVICFEGFNRIRTVKQHPSGLLIEGECSLTIESEES